MKSFRKSFRKFRATGGETCGTDTYRPGRRGRCPNLCSQHVPALRLPCARINHLRPRARCTEAAMPYGGGEGCLTARGLRNVAIASAPSVIVIVSRFLPIDGLWRAATAAWHATRRARRARASAGQRGWGGPGPLGRRESGAPRREARRPPPRARPGDVRPRPGAGVAARAEA